MLNESIIFSLYVHNTYNMNKNKNKSYTHNTIHFKLFLNVNIDNE